MAAYVGRESWSQRARARGHRRSGGENQKTTKRGERTPSQRDRAPVIPSPTKAEKREHDICLNSSKGQKRKTLAGVLQLLRQGTLCERRHDARQVGTYLSSSGLWSGGESVADQPLQAREDQGNAAIRYLVRIWFHGAGRRPEP